MIMATVLRTCWIQWQGRILTWTWPMIVEGMLFICIVTYHIFPVKCILKFTHVWDTYLGYFMPYIVWLFVLQSSCACGSVWRSRRVPANVVEAQGTGRHHRQPRQKPVDAGITVRPVEHCWLVDGYSNVVVGL